VGARVFIGKHLSATENDFTGQKICVQTLKSNFSLFRISDNKKKHLEKYRSEKKSDEM